MPEKLVAYVCPVCRETPGDYYGHLQRPGTRGEFCVNHVTRDPQTGIVTEEKIELVPARD